MTKLNNMCKVCGQTPCNCTSIEESATSHAELAKLAHDAYVQATRKGNGPMAAHYLKQYEKHKANLSKTKKQGVAEGTGESLSFRDMVNVVDEHYPRYYLELSDSDISEDEFKQEIIKTYNEITNKQGVAEESNAPTKYRATVEYGPTAADAHFVTVTANSTEEAEAKVQKWCEKKGVRNPMITINGADKPVDEGLGDIYKGVKRSLKGKPHPDEVAARHFGRVLGNANVGNKEEADKETKRFNKVQALNKGRKTLPDQLEETENGKERKRNALWAQITSYEKRAKETTNDIKRDHLMKMASELRAKLPTTDEEKLAETLNDLAEAMGEQGLAESSKCTCHPGDSDPDCAVHGLEPMDMGDALDVKKEVEEGYDIDDYYSASNGGEYGRDLSYVDNRRNSGISNKHERGGRDDIFKGQVKNLPADPFSRTSGAVPKADGTGRVHTIARPDEVDEGKPEQPEQPEADYGDDYQAMVSRVKKLAGMGPLKTVYDPQKRVYRNVPTAVQPKK